MFSGIGAFEKALERLKIPYELVGYCEIDLFASKAYSLLHGVPESMNFGDITKLNEKILPDGIDLITYGFPCQDISIAGLQKGFTDVNGEKTRSGLFFDALRIIEHTQPQVAIAENVKNLAGKKFNKQFSIVLDSLEAAGYNNYWKILNAMDYEIPHNRERVLIVSIRKDIDTGIFQFPEPVELKRCMGDLLEDEVPEKYFLTAEKLKNIEFSSFNQVRGTTIQEWGGVCKTLLARDYKDPKCVRMIEHEKNDTSCRPSPLQERSDEPGIFPGRGGPDIKDCNRGGREVKILDQRFTAAAQKGRYDENGKVRQHIEISDREYFNALTTVQKDALVSNGSDVRKLTPKEYFRLMGFDDADVDLLVRNGISNSQLYKMAGNSIAVNMLEFLFCQIFDNENKIWV